ncbi:unnamed protein product [Sphagnum jensenii]|uniref:SAP domain-containing protein n=1 Tax=Sphagnum jensenii TaxID=128206 RepID=A0ABP1BB61_9BRYO
MSTPLPAYGNRTPEQLKVAELRDELRRRGVHIKGLKKDLVDRLEELLRHEEQQQQQLQRQLLLQQQEVAVLGTGGVSQALGLGNIDDTQPVTPVLKNKLAEAEIQAGAVVELVAEEAAGQLPEVKLVLENEAVDVGKAIAEELFGDTEHVETIVDYKEAPIATEEKPAQEENGLPEVAEALAASEAVVHEKENDVIESQSQAPAAEEAVVIESDAAPAEEEVAADAAAQQVALQPPVAEAVDEEAALEAVAEPAEEEKSARRAVVEPESGPVIAALDEEAVTPLEEEVVAPMEDEEVIVVTEVVTEETQVTTEEFKSTTEFLVETPGGSMDGEEEEVVEKTVVTQVDNREEEAREEVGEEEAGTTTGEEKIVREEEVIVEEIRDFEQDVEMKTETVVEEESAELQEELEIRLEAAAPEADPELKAKDVKPMEVDIDTQSHPKRKEGDGEGRLQEPSKRQRRWNTGKNDIDVKAPPKVLQTESVKEETSSEVKETAAPSLATLPLAVPASSTPKSASGLERVAISRPALSRSDVPVNGETQKTRVVPPSTKPPTTSLKIDKFLRPFTHKAVKELLANTGAVQAMWMDQIKTHCYVMYSTVDEAVATRNALYNLQWPPQGGRLLTAEFVEPEEVKIRCDGEKAATSNASITRGPVPANNTPAEHVVSAPPPTHPSSLPPVPASGLPPPPPLPPPARERPPMPSKQEMESQGPTLDDLFKKTRAKPHIYYLPLTDQDVAAKLAARRQAPIVKPGVKT